MSSKVFADATQAGGDVIIEVAGVDKLFGDFQALTDINLKIGRRDLVVVIDPS